MVQKLVKKLKKNPLDPVTAGKKGFGDAVKNQEGRRMCRMEKTKKTKSPKKILEHTHLEKPKHGSSMPVKAGWWGGGGGGSWGK